MRVPLNGAFLLSLVLRPPVPFPVSLAPWVAWVGMWWQQRRSRYHEVRPTVANLFFGPGAPKTIVHRSAAAHQSELWVLCRLVPDESS